MRVQVPVELDVPRSTASADTQGRGLYVAVEDTVGMYIQALDFKRFRLKIIRLQ